MRSEGTLGFFLHICVTVPVPNTTIVLLREENMTDMASQGRVVRSEGTLCFCLRICVTVPVPNTTIVLLREVVWQQ